MRGVIRSVLVLVLLGLFTVAATQLPPEILADRYLVKAERLMGEKDYGGAREALNKIVALQKEHNLTLRDEFYFKYARVALSAGAVRVAFDAVKRYLEAAGQAGEFYREALELLDSVAKRYLLQAEQLIAKKDYGAALKAMSKIVVLQRKHNLALPDEFHFKYARVAFSAGKMRVAIDAVKRYLEAAGQAGEFYREALELLDSVAKRYLLQAEQLIAKKNYRFAIDHVNKLVALQKEHNLTLRDEFYFKYARVAFSAGAMRVAIDAVNKYLASAGTAGKFQKKALELLDEAKQMTLPLEPEMVVIPAGRFRMGCVSGRDCDDDEKPVHKVTIAAFALSKYEVTFAEYDRFTAATGRDRAWDRRGWGRGRRPVIYVSWENAVAYTRWLSAQTGERYRLPSEAEWEYAARAGSGTVYSWGNEIGNNRANCRGCGSRWDFEKTAPVGSFGANAWGLHDMHGNLWEWVQDCWNDSYRGAPTNGSAWESGNCSRRVLRGGSWNYRPGSLRAADRSGGTTGGRYIFSGFRVARTLTP